MRRLDGFLSHRAQAQLLGALVYKEPSGSWTLDRPGLDPLGLGQSFGAALRAIDALRHAAQHAARTEEKED